MVVQGVGWGMVGRARQKDRALAGKGERHRALAWKGEMHRARGWVDKDGDSRGGDGLRGSRSGPSARAPLPVHDT